MNRFLVLIAFLSSLSLSLRAVTNTVTMRDFSFSPSVLTNKVGDTVRWVNQGGSHDIESPGVFKSPSPPVSSYSFTFNQAGTFNYRCNPHVGFGMTGRITVQAAANASPTVSITSPASGAVLSSPANVTITANATDDGTIAKVEFFDGGTLIGTAASSPYSVTVTLAVGAHSLTAKATDNLGASTTSAAVSVTVNAPNQAPTVSLTRPADGLTLAAPASVTFESSASDTDGSVAMVEYVESGTSLGSATASPYSVTLTLAAGSHAIFARATDNLGLTGTSGTININVVTATAPKIVSPQLLSPGMFRFVVQGTSGLNHEIQTSTTLTNWIAVGTGVPVNGSFTFTNAVSALPAGRFYRVLVK